MVLVGLILAMAVPNFASEEVPFGEALTEEVPVSETEISETETNTELWTEVETEAETEGQTEAEDPYLAETETEEETDPYRELALTDYYASADALAQSTLTIRVVVDGINTYEKEYTINDVTWRGEYYQDPDQRRKEFYENLIARAVPDISIDDLIDWEEVANYVDENGGTVSELRTSDGYHYSVGADPSDGNRRFQRLIQHQYPITSGPKYSQSVILKVDEYDDLGGAKPANMNSSYTFHFRLKGTVTLYLTPVGVPSAHYYIIKKVDEQDRDVQGAKMQLSLMRDNTGVVDVAAGGDVNIDSSTATRTDWTTGNDGYVSITVPSADLVSYMLDEDTAPAGYEKAGFAYIRTLGDSVVSFDQYRDLSGAPSQAFSYETNVPFTDETGATHNVTVIKVVDRIKNPYSETKLLIEKVDETGNWLSGAELSLNGTYQIGEDIAGKTLEEQTWMSEADSGYATRLYPGTYTLAETKAPDGYLEANDITIEVAADGTVTADGQAVDTQTDEDGNTVYVVKMVDDPIPAEPHLSLAKETTSTPQVTEGYMLGEIISYKVTVTNDGNVDLADVKVVDELTGNIWTVDLLETGKSESFTTDYVATQADVDAKQVTNVVTASGKVAEDPDAKEVKADPAQVTDPTYEPPISPVETEVPDETETFKETETSRETDAPKTETPQTPPEDKAAPKTGDETPLGMMWVLTIAAGAMAFELYRRRKQKQ